IGYPYIAGHEIVGRLVKIGAVAAARWKVAEGARVAIESIVACGRCAGCRAGRGLHCDQRLIYGLTPAAHAPGLLGGYAQYLVLQGNTEVYPLPDHLSVQDAVLFNPLGSGFDWACRAAGTQVGDTVLIIGPGQRGLCSVLAAREAGASRIIVAGRGRRPWKLALALELGASEVVNTSELSLVDAVREMTNGEWIDRVIDTSPLATDTVLEAIRCVRPEGTVVLAGFKEEGGDLGAASNAIMEKAATVKGVFSVSDWAKRQAIKSLSAARYPVSKLHSHTFTIDELDQAFRTLGGEIDGDDALHITVVPS
ncbi:MAG: Threonine dehydrogenase, partial [Acidimicrobiia bacterium]|nr:Threonine dehydrogenase [Acidimicrobiia bacterium]